MKKALANIQYSSWRLVLYDAVLFLFSCTLLLVLHPSEDIPYTWKVVLFETGLSLVSVFFWRFVLVCYRQVWRYGGLEAYIRLMCADALGFLTYFVLERILPVRPIPFIRMLCICTVALLMTLAGRIIYQYLFRLSTMRTPASKVSRTMLRVVAGIDPGTQEASSRRVNIAIIGAGKSGSALAAELLSNPQSPYRTKCFIERSERKVHRQLMEAPILQESSVDKETLDALGVQEVVIAISNLSAEDKQAMYEKYRDMGYGVKLYDFPLTKDVGSGKRQLRDFDVEELLFRSQKQFDYDRIRPCYAGRTVLITGGGGSIGAELGRQIAKMDPAGLVLLDVYENGAYDLQQELRQQYGSGFPVSVEILSVCDAASLDTVFSRYRPDIVIHAAAHKHVPLMEHNCCEAIKNNIFGTKNVVDAAVKYGCGRFLLVSTDKAVNPTNVMGATKRMCEMIVKNAGTHSGKTVFSMTRFGNVLGSSGSVIPLFKRQIEAGGPITVTDRRIIRYFMTIPEASQLVLEAGALATDGELFVLDMGNPVKIVELAETLVNLSGLVPYRDIDIVETGLRPGEKLYEELLIRDAATSVSEDHLIFLENDTAVSDEELSEKLRILLEAAESGDNGKAMEALHRTVPTYRTPEEVNAEAEKAKEMRRAEKN